MTPYCRKSNCEYTSVNKACSDWSSIHSIFSRFALGEQPLLKRLFWGMFEERPTFPRYTVTDDVKYVLDYVKQCSIFSETSLELISKILSTAMCLLSWQRSQTLVFLSTDCMYLNNSRCVFYITNLLKTSHPKSQQQPIKFKVFKFKLHWLSSTKAWCKFHYFY